ncbi:hypothetical protein CB1_001616007 [Camelus ferus]|nr:hypothetical protein CB1_001616007 [Camelus ferus]
MRKSENHCEEVALPAASAFPSVRLVVVGVGGNACDHVHCEHGQTVPQSQGGQTHLPAGQLPRRSSRDWRGRQRRPNGFVNVNAKGLKALPMSLPVGRAPTYKSQPQVPGAALLFTCCNSSHQGVSAELPRLKIALVGLR